MLSAEVHQTSPWFEDRDTERAVYRFINNNRVKSYTEIAKHFGVKERPIKHAVRDLKLAGFIHTDDGTLDTNPLNPTTVQVVLRG